MTQDVRLLTPSGKALHACLTDAKGRLQFRVIIHAAADGAIRVSCEHDGAEGLFARLDRYLIADDATLEDVSTKWTRLHVTGNELPAMPVDAHAVSINRIGVEGWDLWFPAENANGAIQPFPNWDPDEAETLRISAGIPHWGPELSTGLLPPEAGLDRSDISYAKGCYIGQEVISRIKSAGKVNRRLMRITIDDSTACLAGDLLVEADGKEAGQITSVSPLPRDGKRALLAYLKRSSEDRPVFLKSSAPVTIIGRA
jgi:folate-binding protein YgfZ